MAPTVDDVRPILCDFELRMRRVLNAAWDEWMEVPDRGRFSARSRASMVFDFIRTGALEEFDGDPRVNGIIKGQTVHFLFRDRVLVRFKKANNAGLGSNIQTQAVLYFVDPPQLELPDLLPEIHHIEVCYHLDKLATHMDQLAATARQRNRKLWSYELQHPPSAEIVPFPPAPDGGKRPPEVRVRKPKPESEISE